MVEHPGAKGVEAPRLHRNIVEQQRVDDDPHDGPEREHNAVGDGIDREVWRQAPDADRDDQRDDQSRQRRLPRRPAQDTEQDENYRYGEGRNDEGERQTARDRRQQLLEYFLSSPASPSGEPRSLREHERRGVTH